MPAISSSGLAPMALLRLARWVPMAKRWASSRRRAARNRARDRAARAAAACRGRANGNARGRHRGRAPWRRRSSATSVMPRASPAPRARRASWPRPPSISTRSGARGNSSLAGLGLLGIGLQRLPSCSASLGSDPSLSASPHPRAARRRPARCRRAGRSAAAAAASMREGCDASVSRPSGSDTIARHVMRSEPVHTVSDPEV